MGLDDLVGKAKDAADSVGDVAKDLAGDLVEGAKGIADLAKDTADDARDAVEDRFGDDASGGGRGR